MICIPSHNYLINDHFIWGSVLPIHEVIYRYEATLRHLGPSRWLLLPSKSTMIRTNQGTQIQYPSSVAWDECVFVDDLNVHH